MDTSSSKLLKSFNGFLNWLSGSNPEYGVLLGIFLLCSVLSILVWERRDKGIQKLSISFEKPIHCNHLGGVPYYSIVFNVDNNTDKSIKNMKVTARRYFSKFIGELELESYNTIRGFTDGHLNSGESRKFGLLCVSVEDSGLGVSWRGILNWCVCWASFSPDLISSKNGVFTNELSSENVSIVVSWEDGGPLIENYTITKEENKPPKIEKFIGKFKGQHKENG